MNIKEEIMMKKIINIKLNKSLIALIIIMKPFLKLKIIILFKPRQKINVHNVNIVIKMLLYF